MELKRVSAVVLLLVIQFACAEDVTTPLPATAAVIKASSGETDKVPVIKNDEPTVKVTTESKNSGIDAETTTTTAKTTTSATTTTSSTTTTTSPPTPAPTPAPTPTPLEPGIWVYPSNDKNNTCLIVNMAMQLNVTYTLKNNTDVPIVYVLPVTNVTVAGGHCDNNTDSIVLQWGRPGAESKISINFVANNSAFGLSQIQFMLNATDLFPNAADNQTLLLEHKAAVNTSEFLTPMSMSYHCTKTQKLVLNKTIVGSLIGEPITDTMFISHVQWEAFHKGGGDKFSIARDCDAIDTPDIVPIAVGCALAGLVIVVLIAYLVGRRTAQERGYHTL